MQIDARATLADLTSAEKQLRFGVARGLTQIAKAAAADTNASMGTRFDRPVPLTQRSTLFVAATRDSLKAEVYVRDQANGGVPPARYLSAEVLSGPRVAKSYELRLRRAGFLGASEFAVPGDDQTLDSYGNIKGGTFEQMLSQLGAAEQFAGYMANETGRSRKRAGARRRSRFFYSSGRTNTVHGTSRLPRGIFERLGSGHKAPVRSFLIFVEAAPRYTARYPFGDIIRAFVVRTGASTLALSVADALATARPPTGGP